MNLRNKVPFFMQHCAAYYDIIAGTSPLLLPKAKANGLDYVKAFGKCEQRNLPEGYTQYEYLRSTGTQYIDLGYKGNGNTKVEVKFRYHTATTTSGSGRVFGSRSTAQTNAFAIGTSSGYVSSEEANQIFWCFDNQPFYVDSTKFSLGEWKTVIFSATEHSIDGVSVGDDYNIVEFETPTTLKLFGFDQWDGTVGIGYVDIASCKLWNNGVLVRDLAPAGYGTTNSMYDKVSGAMLPNAGTGDFVAGPAAVPTPDEPMNIISNNGVIKYSVNMANVNSQTALLGYYISAQGVATADANNWIYQQFIPVKPNTTYTLSLSSAVYFVSISEYATADDSGFIVRKAGSTGANTQLTITTGATTNFVRFGTNIDRTEVTLEEVLAINWMLNEGGTALPYAPYSESGIYTDGTIETIQDSLNNIANAETLLKVGGYQDAQEVIAGIITRNIGIKVLDGTENWQLATAANLVQFYAQSTQGIIANNVSIYSTIAPYGCTVANRTEYDFGCYSGGTGNLCFQMKGSATLTTVNAWTTFLAEQYANGTPIIIIYPLATPTTETVAGQTLNTQEGSNSLTITQASLEGLTLEARYKRGR